MRCITGVVTHPKVETPPTSSSLPSSAPSMWEHPRGPPPDPTPASTAHARFLRDSEGSRPRGPRMPPRGPKTTLHGPRS
eukprot:3769542-Pyramimonas_sp.AAC.1